ncbi:MAG: sigma-54-dependent transcriptional regulator [Gammaproteobacteria bacterium]
MESPAIGLILVSGDGIWSRALGDALRRRGLERLVFATPKTVGDALEGKAAIFIDGRLRGEAAASVARALRESGAAICVILVEAEAVEPDGTIAELAHWRAARLPDEQELSQLLAAARGAPRDNERSPELCRALVGDSEAIAQVRALIERVASTDTTVLITGEPGSGKEVVARNIHFRSSRRPGPFVSLNCTAAPRERLDSELFGRDSTAGQLERADGGTLFLDGIADMPHDTQSRLLRVLRERLFERVGSETRRRCNVRIIAATHCDLEHAIAAHRFREELYYRLNVFPIHMPALRERRADIPPLFRELVARQKAETGREVSLTPVAMQLLQRHHWHGNVRELANLVERLSILYPGAEIDGAQLLQHFVVRANDSPTNGFELPTGHVDLRGFVRDVERRLIERALRDANGVTAHAATLLNMRRTTLMHKMKTLRAAPQRRRMSS